MAAELATIDLLGGGNHHRSRVGDHRGDGRDFRNVRRTLADTVFHSGPVFDGRRLLDGISVGVSAGRIVSVGPDDEVRAALPAAADLDLEGRLLLPGFTDAHVHALSAGVDRNACDLTGSADAADGLARVAAYASRHEGPWIVGSGWSMSHFVGGAPTVQTLDEVVPDRPAFLLNRDHHGAWVNSRALAVAGIDAATPDPVDGRIERDARGAPTGTLHEGAMALVSRLVPPATPAEQLAGLATAQQYLHSLGITGWQEAIVGDYPGMGDLAEIYAGARDDGMLTADVVGASWLPRAATVDDVASLVADFVARRAATAGGRWSMHAVKIMVDGVVENRTAHLSDPYCSETAGIGCVCTPSGARGLAYFDPEMLAESVIACDAAGLDVHFHAIGDAAVTAALDAVQAARRANGITGARHHIAHLQLVRPADIERFVRLGVAVNMQALWACADAEMTDLVLPAVGEHRYRWHYPFGSLARTGAVLAMGSDWPVSTPDPWAAISVAVNRIPPGGHDEPLLPTESLDLPTALAAYTSGSAWLNRRARAGTIRIGAGADLVIADRNPFDRPPAEIWRTGTDLVIADGTIVYERAHP
ncbi:amidohydrolase [Gordonia sp. NPDC003376]